jgi:hypothetical protein
MRYAYTFLIAKQKRKIILRKLKRRVEQCFNILNTKETSSSETLATFYQTAWHCPADRNLWGKGR